MNSQTFTRKIESRRHFIGGSDARIIMGPDEAGLLRLGSKSAVSRVARPSYEFATSDLGRKTAKHSSSPQSARKEFSGLLAIQASFGFSIRARAAGRHFPA